MAVNQKLTHTVGGRSILQIDQTGTTLEVTFTDSSTMRIRLEDAASSVMVRASSGELEYAD